MYLIRYYTGVIDDISTRGTSFSAVVPQSSIEAARRRVRDALFLKSDENESFSTPVAEGMITLHPLDNRNSCFGPHLSMTVEVDSLSALRDISREFLYGLPVPQIDNNEYNF